MYGLHLFNFTAACQARTVVLRLTSVLQTRVKTAPRAWTPSTNTRASVRPDLQVYIYIYIYTGAPNDLFCRISVHMATPAS